MNWYCVYCHHLDFTPWNFQIEKNLKKNISTATGVCKAKHFVYRVAQKKRPILFFIQKFCFTILFHTFQVVQTADLRVSFDTNMHPNGRFTTQQRIKIIEAYFATKSVLLTQWQYRRDFGRNDVCHRRTIQRLVAKFWETGSVAGAPQRPQWSPSLKSFKSNKPGSFSIL